MFKMTIFAARRVFPPLLMTPAKASYPRINETGPLGLPPPRGRSRSGRLVHAAAEDPSTALGAAIAGWDYPAEVTDLMKTWGLGD